VADSGEFFIELTRSLRMRMNGVFVDDANHRKGSKMNKIMSLA